MPMLILHCRIRLYLAFIQQRSILGGAPTLRLQGQPMNFTLISHHAFQYFSLLNKIYLMSILFYRNYLPFLNSSVKSLSVMLTVFLRVIEGSLLKSGAFLKLQTRCSNINFIVHLILFASWIAIMIHKNG